MHSHNRGPSTEVVTVRWKAGQCSQLARLSSKQSNSLLRTLHSLHSSLELSPSSRTIPSNHLTNFFATITKSTRPSSQVNHRDDITTLLLTLSLLSPARSCAPSLSCSIKSFSFPFSYVSPKEAKRRFSFRLSLASLYYATLRFRTQHKFASSRRVLFSC